LTTLDDQLQTNNTESTQARAFKAGELVACPICSRANPPTRANCLYCGAELGIRVQATTSSATAAASETEVEEVENVIAVLAGSETREPPIEIAQLLNLTPTELNMLLGVSVAPLYATTAINEAQAISENLRSAGFESLIVSDAQLHLATPPKQIAAVTLTDHALTAFVRRTGERVSVPWGDIVLIVPGRLYFMTTEVEHTPDKSKQMLDERQLTSDEEVLDIYSGADGIGWRIRAGSFDFSCLGSEKKATAFENFRALADLLTRSSPQAVRDDGYVRIRLALNKVWPLAARAGATERRRTLAGTIDATATVSDNELQFTRYSRLLRFVHDSALEDDARQS